MARRRRYDGRCPKCSAMWSMSTLQSHRFHCPQCGHPLDESSKIRVLDSSGAILTPCTPARAEEEVGYGNAVWLDDHSIRLRFSAIHKKEYRATVFRRDRGKCVWCGDDAETVDHIIPESKGGRFHPKNLMCACFSCNQARKNLDVPDFLALRTQSGSEPPRPRHILSLYREALRFQHMGMPRKDTRNPRPSTDKNSY
jgi:hypothetical protein